MTDVASSQSPIIAYASDEGRYGRAMKKQSSSSSTKGGTTAAAPRFEAFVMTGDKMLRLDPKISANYAKVKQMELPEHIQVATALPVKSGFHFDPEPTVEHVDNVASTPSSQQSGEQQLSSLYKTTETALINSSVLEAEESSAKVQDAQVATEETDAEEESAVLEEHVMDGLSESQQSSYDNGRCDVQADLRVAGMSVESDDGGSLSSAIVRAGGVDAARRLASRLYEVDGFRPDEVAEQLCKSDEFSKLVAQEFINMFNFSLFRIDAALRLFLCYLFPTPSQQWDLDKVPLKLFAHRYQKCNPCLFSGEDEVYSLACALCALNVNLHSDVSSVKMTCHDFIEEMSRSEHSYSRDLLKMLYHSVKSLSLKSNTSVKRSDRTVPSSDRLTLLNERLRAPEPESQAEYKKGWVMRKCIVDKGGKKVPFGRRGWRMFFAVLKGTILYLQKDEENVTGCTYITYRNAIGLHHAYATRAGDYTKRKHVFKLCTYTYAEFLFQTSEPSEVHSWVTAINFTAACFSAPKPIDESVDSGQCSLFTRPVRPSATTKLSLDAQLKSHEQRIQEIESSLETLRQNPPCRSCKQYQLVKFAEREVYLLFELQRYRTYVGLLQRVNGESDCEELRSVSRQNYFESKLLSSPGGRSGQSDRLSYCAAIDNFMSADSP